MRLFGKPGAARKASGATRKAPGGSGRASRRNPGDPKRAREPFGGHRETPGRVQGGRGRATGSLARAPAKRKLR